MSQSKQQAASQPTPVNRRAFKPELQEVDVPDYGPAFVRTISIKERGKILTAFGDLDETDETPVCDLAALLVVDENVEPIASSDEWGYAMGKWSVPDYTDFVNVLMDKSGLRTEEAKKD